MLIKSPRDRVSLSDILQDVDIQCVLKNPTDGNITYIDIIISCYLGHWSDLLDDH